MTVVDTGPFSDAVVSAASAERRRRLRVEPTVGLQWSQAIEQWSGEDATTPAQARRTWIHRAPEQQVLALYRTTRAADPDAPAPWWLRAITAGTLDSRADGFAVEDRLAALLSARTGWVYVPWNTDGDSGYWEFVPSERTLTEPGVPTTLMLTDRHPGWIDLYRAHAGPPPDPIAVAGLGELRTNLVDLESLPPA